MAMPCVGEKKRTQFPALYFPEASVREKRSHKTLELNQAQQLEATYVLTGDNRDPELGPQRM